MDTLGTRIAEGINKYSGLALADEGLGKFTNSATYKQISNVLGSGTASLNINNTKRPVKKDETGSFTAKFNESIKKIDSTIGVTVSAYTTPTRLALDAFGNIGKDIDKQLQKSFLLQKLNLKGTDILCSAFCFLISTMSCKVRTELYEALKNANKAGQAANLMANAANNIINTVGATMASSDAIVDSAKSLFGKDKSKDKATRAIQATSTLIAAPVAIMKNAEMILNMLKLGTQYKFIMPETAGKCIWDLSSNVLFALQGMAVQAADEALSKVTNPIEQKIKEITPSPCFGTMATRLQQALIQKIREFKSWLLAQIADLFTANTDFMLNFGLKVDKSALALELQAFAISLKHITAHFFEVAANCGLSPCKGQSSTSDTGYSVDDIGNLTSTIDDDPFGRINGVPGYYDAKYLPPPVITGVNIEELAKKMAPSLGLDVERPSVYVTPSEVLAVYSMETGDLPSKIVDIIKKGALNSVLDASYSVYASPNSEVGSDSNIKIVYRFDKKCGEK